MSNITQDTRQAQLYTPLGYDVLKIQHFKGVEKLSEPFRYSMTVLGHDSEVDGSQIIGKPISVVYHSEEGRQSEFHGWVSRFEYLHQIQEPEPMTAYQMIAVPWFWFLKHNRDCKIFQHMTAPDIIKQIFRERGYTDFRLQLTESYKEREYCVQYCESDFDFVSRLLEEEGIFYYFQQAKESHTMVLCDSPRGYFDLDEEDVVFKPIGQQHFAQLTEWRHVYEFGTGKVAQRDFNFKQPRMQLESETPTEINYDRSGGFEQYEYPGLFEEQGDGDRLATVRAQEAQHDFDRVEGKGVYLSFSPGGRFGVAHHIRKSDASKKFVLTEVITEFNSNLGFGHDNQDDFSNEFVCIAAERTFRPQRRTPKPVVEGPQTAIVVTDGQEIVVDEFARVKVQFHWDRYGQRDVNSSCWIRVSQAHAGRDWGMIDIPRKDEEVIVSFLNGDPDQPIITGRVYNGENHPPYDLKGAGNNLKNRTRRGNTTKTYEDEGFNEISMDDAKGKEQIRIHAQKRMDTFVLGSSFSTVKGSQHLTIGQDGDPEPSGNQSELVWRDKLQTVKNEHREHIEANKYLRVGNGSGANGNLDVAIERDEYRSVGQDSHLKVSRSMAQKIDGGLTIDVGKDYMHRVGGDIGLEAGARKEIHLKAGTVSIESMSSMCLRGPGGFITIDQTGIHIVGQIVNINSGGGSLSGKPCQTNPPKPPTAVELVLDPPSAADCYRIDHDRSSPEIETATPPSSSAGTVFTDADPTPPPPARTVFTDADPVPPPPARTVFTDADPATASSPDSDPGQTVFTSDDEPQTSPPPVFADEQPTDDDHLPVFADEQPTDDDHPPVIGGPVEGPDIPVDEKDEDV